MQPPLKPSGKARDLRLDAAQCARCLAGLPFLYTHAPAGLSMNSCKRRGAGPIVGLPGHEIRR